MNELAAAVRANYTLVCKCEWEDQGYDEVIVATSKDCVIHGDANDPLDALLAERDHWHDEYLAACKSLTKRIHQGADAVRALRTLRDAWNAHMETCPQHAALPDLEPPTWAELQAWANAPNDTAAGGVLAPRENHDADVSGAVDPLDDPHWESPSPPDLIGDPNFDPKGDDELSV